MIYIQDKESISIEDVNSVVGASRKYNVFELQKAVGERNMEKTLKILNSMLSSERQEMLIITMLTRYFTVLWKLLDESKKISNNYQLAGKVGVSPFFIPEYISAMRRYKPEELDMAFLALLQADTEIKSTSGKSMYIMQKMIMSIIEGKKAAR